MPSNEIVSDKAGVSSLNLAAGVRSRGALFKGQFTWGRIMPERNDPMQHDPIQYGTETAAYVGPSKSIVAATPYLKALGLVTTLLIAWAGICAN